MDAKALNKITYGMYVVSSKDGGKLNGQIANTVFQVTAQPAQISVCLNKTNATHAAVMKSSFFAVSVLDQEATMVFVGRFGFRSGKDYDKFAETGYRLNGNGFPVVTDFTIATLEAEVVSTIDVGTHTIFVGKIVESEILNDKTPMTYEYYHLVKGGKTSQAAPTYQGKI